MAQLMITQKQRFFFEGTDVSAWNCLVGCSDGLRKLKDIFNRGRNKTNHDEIRFPYRNGILHKLYLPTEEELHAEIET